MKEKKPPAVPEKQSLLERLGLRPLPQPSPLRLVVCAACRDGGTGAIVTGPRHMDALMQTAMANFEEVYWRDITYGFVDQRGVFMTREEAWKVAEAGGQIWRRHNGDTANGGTLFTENLY